MLIIDRRSAKAEPNKAPIFDEIATTEDGRDITRGYVEALPLLQPQDSLLASRAYNYQIYEEVLRDDQVKATFEQRRQAVTSCEYEVIPGGKMRRDRVAAEDLQEQLGNLQWDSATDKMLYGVFYGFSVGELIYARDGGKVRLARIAVRKQRRFGFGPDMDLKLLTTGNPNGEPMPDRKFWVFQVGADNDDEPYGLALGHWLYWPAYFKRNGVKFWLYALEKYGQPTAKGEFPRGATDVEKRKLLTTLRSIQKDSGIIHPEGYKIGLLESMKYASGEHNALVSVMDAAITKVTLGQTMTTEDGSSESQARVHWDVRQGIVKADADLSCMSFNAGPARWLTEWNHPGAAMPQVWRRLEGEPDLKARSEVEKNVFSFGYRPTLAQVKETYGGEWEPVTPAGAAPGKEPAPKEDDQEEQEDGGAEFAEDDDEDVPARYAEQLDQEAAGAMDGLLEPVRKLVQQATSLEDLRDLLLDAYGEMDIGDLGNLMAQALAAAELAGRWEVASGR